MQSVVNQYKHLDMYSYVFSAPPGGAVCWIGFYKADGSAYAFGDRTSESVLAAVDSTAKSLTTLLRDANYLGIDDELPAELAAFCIRTSYDIVVETTGEVNGGTAAPSKGGFTLGPGAYLFGNTLFRMPALEIGQHVISAVVNTVLHGSFVRKDGTIADYSGVGTHSLELGAGSASTLYSLLADTVDPAAYPSNAVGFIGRLVPTAGNATNVYVNTGGSINLANVYTAPDISAFTIDVAGSGSNFVLGEVPESLKTLYFGGGGDSGFGTYSSTTSSLALSGQVITAGSTVNITYDNTEVGPLGYTRLLVNFTPVTGTTASLTVNVYPMVGATVCADRAIETYTHATSSTTARSVWVDIPHGMHRLSFTAATVNMSAVSAYAIKYPQS